jgi:hypothetical protein
LCAFALGALGVLLRLLAVPAVLPDTDAVNFALALERFDLSLHQPHFPGYPLYVLCARAFARWVEDPALALALPGVVASAPLVLLVYRALWPTLSAAALLPAALVATHPLLVSIGGAPGSDGLALAIVGCALCGLLVGQRWRIASALAMGLALGVRPSYFPLALSFLVAVVLLAPRRPAALVMATGGLVLGVLGWLLPLVAIVGLGTLFTLGQSHIGGHFSTWGGTSSRGIGESALLTLSHGGLPLLPLAAWVLVSGRRGVSVRGVAGVVLAALPYVGWLLFAQNAEHARHAAPLALLFSAGLGIWVASLARGEASEPRRVSFSMLALACVPLLFSVLRPVTQEPAEAVRAVTWVGRTLGTERVLLLGTHTPRLAAYYAPPLRTGLVRDVRDLERIVARFGEGVTVVATSEVPGLETGPLRLALLSRFGETRVYAVGPQTASATLEIPR